MNSSQRGTVLAVTGTVGEQGEFFSLSVNSSQCGTVLAVTGTIGEQHENNTSSPYQSEAALADLVTGYSRRTTVVVLFRSSVRAS